jgi:hypothetical protein
LTDPRRGKGALRQGSRCEEEMGKRIGKRIGKRNDPPTVYLCLVVWFVPEDVLKVR